MRLKHEYRQIWQNEKIRFSLLFIFLGLISFFLSKTNNRDMHDKVQEVVQLDELIPEGLVLLPLDLVNREALSSIMGSAAVIDLFTVNSQTLNPSKKIASRVKIIRTPRNPDQFALLVKEHETIQILNQTGPYFAVIQNKSRKGSRLAPTPQSREVQISYQEVNE